jgi:hypothetical protein
VTNDPGGSEGAGIIRVDAIGTAVFVAVTVLAAVWDGDAADLVNLVVSGVLFLGGCAAFAVGFARAAGRSRTEIIDLAGLFYLTGSAPKEPRRLLLGLWFAQIVVAAASVAVVQPPFGVMAPVWGIGLLTVWGARHGTFPPRPVEDRLGRRSAPQ